MNKYTQAIKILKESMLPIIGGEVYKTISHRPFVSMGYSVNSFSNPGYKAHLMDIDEEDKLYFIAKYEKLEAAEDIRLAQEKKEKLRNKIEEYKKHVESFQSELFELEQESSDNER